MVGDNLERIDDVLIAHSMAHLDNALRLIDDDVIKTEHAGAVLEHHISAHFACLSDESVRKEYVSAFREKGYEL